MQPRPIGEEEPPYVDDDLDIALAYASQELDVGHRLPRRKCGTATAHRKKSTPQPPTRTRAHYTRSKRPRTPPEATGSESGDPFGVNLSDKDSTEHTDTDSDSTSADSDSRRGKRSSSDSDSEEDNQQHKVSAVLDARRGSDGGQRREYLVSWWGSKEQTWVDEKDCLCSALIRKFWSTHDAVKATTDVCGERTVEGRQEYLLKWNGSRDSQWIDGEDCT
jgi:hypothetical protein